MIIRRCVLKIEQGEILDKCHTSPHGGHFAGEITAYKFYNHVFIGLLYSKTVLNG